ncbi:MAG TPA: hypothetical protein VKT52_00060 [Ktedonobacterales bacterium]|nr:hypothetical protein [Ktedonobacterales bacterium]
MFVQRLQRWLRRLAASLFHSHSTDLLPPERTAVLSASLRDDGQAAGPGGASWLDDGRRLRPRPSPPAKLDQRWNTRPAAPRRPVPTQPQLGRSPSIRPAAERPAPEPPRQKPAEPAARREDTAVPTQPLHASEPPLSAFGSTSPTTDGQPDYRRLMALKRLVRLGIYNEGFDSSRVPEQYLYSLGHEDDLSAE